MSECYRDRCTIRRRVEATNDPQPNYSGDAAIVLRSVPCTVINVSGGETRRGRQIEATIQWLIEMPSQRSNAVRAAMVVEVTAGKYAGTVLEIEKVVELTPRAKPPKLELQCVLTQ